MEATAKTEVRLNLDPREYILLLSMTAPYGDAAQLRRIIAKSRRVVLTGPEARYLMDWVQNRHPEWSDAEVALAEKLWHTLSKLELKFEPVPEAQVSQKLSTLLAVSKIGQECAHEFKTLFMATLRGAIMRVSKGVGTSGHEAVLQFKDALFLRAGTLRKLEYHSDDACDVESFVFVSSAGDKNTVYPESFMEDDCLDLVIALERNGMLGDAE